jgi:pentatricopeptide repeat protein
MRSSEENSIEEVCKLLHELLKNDAVVNTTDPDELDRINSAFAQVIHALLEKYDPSDDTVRNPSAHLIEKADTLEFRIMALYENDDTPLMPNTTAMNARIALFGAKHSVQPAISLLNQMIEAAAKDPSTAIAPNRVSFNTVINACAKAGKHEAARDTLRLMMAKRTQKLTGVSPDIFSFNTLLNAYSNSGLPDAGRNAERILDWMEDLAQTEGFELSPDAYSYTAVIDAYAKSRSSDRAEAVLRRLLDRQSEGHNVAPTVVTFTAVMHAISRNKDRDALRRAKALIGMMEELNSAGISNVAPTTATYNALLNVCNKSRDYADSVNEALTILEDMKSKPEYAIPNCRTYNTVLATLSSAKGDYLITAEKIVEEMKESEDPAVQPNSITYNILLNVLSNAKTTAAEIRSQEIFSMMRKHENDGNLRLAPVSETYNIMMKIASKSGEGGAHRAEMLLNQLEDLYDAGDSKVRPTTISYATCITAWAREHDEEKIFRANDLMRRMKEAYADGNRQAKPNTTSYNALLSCYKNVSARYDVRRGDQKDIIDGVLTLLREMRKSDSHRPDAITYITVVKTLVNLPIQDERLDVETRRVLSLCQEDNQISEQLMRLLKRAAPRLLQ